MGLSNLGQKVCNFNPLAQAPMVLGSSSADENIRGALKAWIDITLAVKKDVSNLQFDFHKHVLQSRVQDLSGQSTLLQIYLLPVINVSAEVILCIKVASFQFTLTLLWTSKVDILE